MVGADYTQRFTRYQTEVRYTTQPDGIPGNCDYAAMSSWYLFAALGFYPISGTPLFILGSPIFPKTVLYRDKENKSTLSILAHNAGPENIYVEKATLNGNDLDMKSYAFINFEEFTTGNDVLEFWMTDLVPSFYTN